MQEYDGISNDLLTGGLGASGIEFGAPAPGFADPENPSAEELRTLATQTNYRAVLDPSPAGGFGSLYGPNVAPGEGDGKIAGKGYLAYADNETGKKNVTLFAGLSMAVKCDFFNDMIDHLCIKFGGYYEKAHENTNFYVFSSYYLLYAVTK